VPDRGVRASRPHWRTSSAALRSKLYARGDMLARRRQLMETWAEFTVNSVVVPLRLGADRV
jgi:hypothetical protein